MLRHRMAVQVDTSAELVVAHADTSCQADGDAGRHGWCLVVPVAIQADTGCHADGDAGRHELSRRW